MSLNQKYPITPLNKGKGVNIQRIPHGHDDWYEYRLQGIGGSDVAYVLGMTDTKYKSVIEVFYEKIGLKPQKRDTNNFMWWGKDLEENVANAWKYHDGTEYGYIKNAEEGIIKRECRNINGYITNEKYPHLYVSIDRMINQGSFNLLNAQLLKKNGILECKTGSGWVSKKWENGIDPSYVAQTQMQLEVLDLDYAEIAFLELDARELHVYPMMRDRNFCDNLLENTRSFWNDMVTPARALAQAYLLANERGQLEECKKITAEIQNYEPAPDGTESYKAFMNKRWLSEPTIVKASEEDIQNAREFVYLNNIEKQISKELLLRENTIRATLGQCDTLDCDAFGKVTWKSDVNGKRTMRTSAFKFDPAPHLKSVEEFIVSQIPKL